LGDPTAKVGSDLVRTLGIPAVEMTGYQLSNDIPSWQSLSWFMRRKLGLSDRQKLRIVDIMHDQLTLYYQVDYVITEEQEE